MNEWKLKYKKPANTWFEALPLGNGKMGAMLYSGIKQEKISLNLDTLWSGDGHYKGKKLKKTTWDEVKNSLMVKDYDLAEKIVKDEVLCDWTDSYLPVGDINICFYNIADEVSKYKRELLLNEAINSLSFVSGGKTYIREAFTSLNKNVLLLKLSVKEGENYVPFSFDVEMSTQLKYTFEKVGDDEICILGRAPIYVAPDYFDCAEPIRYEKDKGMRFSLGLKVVQNSGCIDKVGNKLVVSSEGETYLIFSGNTDFHLGGEYKNKVWEEIYSAEKIGYDELKSKHIEEYKKLFDRFNLSLSEDDSFKEWDTLELLEEPIANNYLYELMFHYARYLMISSSMEGSECANLQGIWNKYIRPPWSSNYTVNINTQMNYWFVESVNLSECHMPLFDLMDRSKKQGEITARQMYDSNGWVTHHNIDIWGHSTPVGKGSSYFLPQAFSMWQMSSGWLCRHLWEHYLHTCDIAFLRDRAYPLIEGALIFYLDNLVEIDGKLGLVPSTSPENIFIGEDGKKHALSYFSSMDIGILKDLFGYYLQMCALLGVEEDYRLRIALEKLPDFKVTSKGCLAEWYFDYEEEDENHRHVSHLYGLYPAALICDNDVLLDASKCSLDRRGDDGTGWAIAWRACLRARLKDGNRALSLLDKQLKLTREEEIKLLGGGTYPNLFCAHPPFQIDGNFGFAAAVIEILVQSHNGCLEFLPALPQEWNKGEVSGMILRGGYEVSFKWENGEIYYLRIISKHKGKVTIKYNGLEETVDFSDDMIFQFG